MVGALGRVICVCLVLASCASVETPTNVGTDADDTAVTTTSSTTTTSTPGTETADESTADLWEQRESIEPDPNDPEPIASTGTNRWDLITDADRSTFVCLERFDPGGAELLAADKSGYELVPGVHHYLARFEDGTTVEVRVHPEVGDDDAAVQEVTRYLAPLGRLPSLLRADVGRLAIRAGDETATASFMEGISVQTGNIDVRVGDDRLEETLFHEAVHTSLDHLFSYQRSSDWLAAQVADGRWLTEYGRENPDSEDLAETALYAFALLHHPDRFEPTIADALRDRAPNRVDFIADLFPPGEPIHDPPVAPRPSCS